MKINPVKCQALFGNCFTYKTTFFGRHPHRPLRVINIFGRILKFNASKYFQELFKSAQNLFLDTRIKSRRGSRTCRFKKGLGIKNGGKDVLALRRPGGDATFCLRLFLYPSRWRKSVGGLSSLRGIDYKSGVLGPTQYPVLNHNPTEREELFSNQQNISQVNLLINYAINILFASVDKRPGTFCK